MRRIIVRLTSVASTSSNAMREEAGTFEDWSKEKQDRYIEKHPGSKYAKNRKAKLADKKNSKVHIETKVAPKTVKKNTQNFLDEEGHLKHSVLVYDEGRAYEKRLPEEIPLLKKEIKRIKGLDDKKDKAELLKLAKKYGVEHDARVIGITYDLERLLGDKEFDYKRVLDRQKRREDKKDPTKNVKPEKPAKPAKETKPKVKEAPLVGKEAVTKKLDDLGWKIEKCETAISDVEDVNIKDLESEWEEDHNGNFSKKAFDKHMDKLYARRDKAKITLEKLLEFEKKLKEKLKTYK
jgi:hypothetical protein